MRKDFPCGFIKFYQSDVIFRMIRSSMKLKTAKGRHWKNILKCFYFLEKRKKTSGKSGLLNSTYKVKFENSLAKLTIIGSQINNYGRE